MDMLYYFVCLLIIYKKKDIFLLLVDFKIGFYKRFVFL